MKDMDIIVKTILILSLTLLVLVSYVVYDSVHTPVECSLIDGSLLDIANAMDQTLENYEIIITN